jgi:hypothetical protein
VILLGLASGCAGAAGGARSTLLSYASAVERNDPEGAWRLLSERARRHISRERFLSQFASYRAEALAQSTAIRQALRQRPAPDGSRALEVAATVPAGNQPTSQLRVEDGYWRVLSAPGQSALASPATTLRAFVRALERRDVDQIMRLLAKQVRVNLEKSLRDRLERMKGALNRDTIEVHGDRAELRYDRQWRIQLVRENGEWRVSNFD